MGKSIEDSVVVNVILGDPHVMLKNLEETEKMFSHVEDQVNKLLDKDLLVNLIIMGDGQHNHAVIRMEVLNAWDRFFNSMSKFRDLLVIYLTGNHDISGIKSREREESSFSVFKSKYKNLIVVQHPMSIQKMAFVPYTSDEDTFKKDCKDLFDKGAKETLFCHQTFQGNMYENGMYAPDGFDLDSVPQGKVYSGHIHKKQEFGKLISVGTWRWMTKSDANEEKGYHICKADERTGKLGKLRFVSTEGICTKMVKHVVSEGEEVPELREDQKNYVTLIGSSKWINKVRQGISEKAIVSSHKTDKVVKRVSEKVESIDQFLDSHWEPESQVTKEEVRSYIGKL